jgi:hypothetical protein
MVGLDIMNRSDSTNRAKQGEWCFLDPILDYCGAKRSMPVHNLNFPQASSLIT